MEDIKNTTAEEAVCEDKKEKKTSKIKKRKAQQSKLEKGRVSLLGYPFFNKKSVWKIDKTVIK